MAAKNEKASFIRSFKINDNRYYHYIFCSEDDRVECQDKDANVVVTYTASGEMHSNRGITLGRFSMRDKQWKFTSSTPLLNDSVFDIAHPESLLHFELQISKEYIESLAAFNKT